MSEQQPNHSSDQGMTIFSLLLAGMGFYGLLGWLIDNWLDTVLFMPIGVLVGMAGSIYLVIKRYGSMQ